MKAEVLKVLVLGLLGRATPARAHHSFAGEYDGTKPVTVTGTVIKSEWTNPHARFYVDTKETDGSITHWEFELGSPNLLIRYGFSRDLLKIGEDVTNTDNQLTAYVVVDLLSRIGRQNEALELACKYLAESADEFGLSLPELCAQADRLDLLKDLARSKGDVVNFAAALLGSRQTDA